MSGRTGSIILTAVLLLTLSEARAAFSGWPIADSGEYWWEAIRTNDYHGQLIRAAGELIAAAGSSTNALWSETIVLPLGMTSSVEVVEGVTYTNFLLQTTNVTLTNFLGSYAYTDNAGTNQDAALALSAAMLEVPMLSSALIGGFVDPDLAVGGKYDAWFATADAASNVPSSFPLQHSGALYQRLGIGAVWDLQTNGWGQVKNSNWAGGGLLTYEPSIARTVILAQAVCTGSAWVVTAFNPSIKGIWKGDQTVAHVVASTSGVSGTVTLYGKAVVDQGPAEASMAVRWVQADATETVAIGAACTQAWVTVTNIDVSGSGGTGDAVRVVFDYAGALFNNTFDPCPTLRSVTLDELKLMLDDLQWTPGGVGSTQSLSYGWTYTTPALTTGTWAQAKAGCAAATPTITTNSVAGFPLRGTRGNVYYDEYGYTRYRAIASARADVYDLSAGALARPKDADIYVVVNRGPFEVWNPLDDGWASNSYTHLFYQTVSMGTNEAATTFVIGTTAFPTEWCDEPTFGDSTSEGWSYSTGGGDPLAVLKWAFEHAD